MASIMPKLVELTDALVSNFLEAKMVKVQKRQSLIPEQWAIPKSGAMGNP